LQHFFSPWPFRGAAQSVTVVDRIATVRNTRKSSRVPSDEAVGAAERELRRPEPRRAERGRVQHQMLERLISEGAVQMARETGIRVDELQLDRAVQRIARNNTNGDLAELATPRSGGVSVRRLARGPARADPPDAAARARGGTTRSR